MIISPDEKNTSNNTVSENITTILPSIVPKHTASKTPHNYEVELTLLRGVLLPLHLPDIMIEWRDQIPVIQVCTYIQYCMYIYSYVM